MHLTLITLKVNIQREINAIDNNVLGQTTFNMISRPQMDSKANKSFVTIMLIQIILCNNIVNNIEKDVSFIKFNFQHINSAAVSLWAKFYVTHLVQNNKQTKSKHLSHYSFLN